MDENLANLTSKLSSLYSDMENAARSLEEVKASLPLQQQGAFVNLVHYLNLRCHDIRPMQEELHALGLSSLSNAENHILKQLGAVLRWLGDDRANKTNWDWNNNTQCADNASILFGEKTERGIPYIMVTFDTSFADDYDKVKNLMEAGMNVARINCAHDDEKTWKKMINYIRRAEQELSLHCKIYMDIAGPKIRTVLWKNGKKKKKIDIDEGQLIWLTDNEPTKDDSENEACIQCSFPGIITQLNNGAKVIFDDGIIECSVQEKKAGRVLLRVERLSSDKKQLKSDKGINFPGSSVTLEPLTEFDKQCMPFICSHADLAGYSFLRSPGDIDALSKLMRSEERKPVLILKIETPEAVDNFASLLVKGMEEPVFGVMIARGDLAIEIGFERMGEIQEELMWICEAAHVPVIWATQVLENMNKAGIPSRAEITDAMHASVAECVMINKGAHAVQVIKALLDIFRRSKGHHNKKRYLFRELHLAQHFFEQAHQTQRSTLATV